MHYINRHQKRRDIMKKICAFMPLLALCGIMVGCAGKPQYQEHVTLKALATGYDMGYSFDGEAFALSGYGSRRFLHYSIPEGIVGRVGDRAIFFDRVKVWLAYPVVDINGTAAIRDVDWMMTLAPLFLYPVDGFPVAGRKVVLDPGHGGDHPGAIGAISEEKDINLSVAKQVGERLEAAGVKVIYTRTGDETVELPPRAAAGGQSGADMFLSIHCNAAPNPSASGIETFSIAPQGAANSNDIDNSLRVDVDSNATGYDMVKDSMALSYSIQKRLMASFDVVDRGAKRARFHVLYHNTVPAALVECGFMSNEAEEQKLNDPDYQARLADAIAAGVIDYLGRRPISAATK